MVKMCLLVNSTFPYIYTVKAVWDIWCKCQVFVSKMNMSAYNLQWKIKFYIPCVIFDSKQLFLSGFHITYAH